jgi:hypothetical protein
MVQSKKVHSALSHGGYAAKALLPGEDSAAFEKLHRNLIAELAPTGSIEEDIVATLARLVWRKQNMATYRIAKFAQKRYAVIEGEKLRDAKNSLFPNLERVQAVRAAAQAQAREELGDAYALVEFGETATLDQLMKELSVEDRIDAMIERCLKRLLLLRGLKSLAPSTASSTLPPAVIAPPTSPSLSKGEVGDPPVV